MMACTYREIRRYERLGSTRWLIDKTRPPPVQVQENITEKKNDYYPLFQLDITTLINIFREP